MYLEAVNLSKKYGKFYALKNLNLKIEGKKCVGYLGPNGAGKTTTLKLFTHLLQPTDGEAIINGYSVKKDIKRALKDVGTLIESPDFYPYLTAEEVLNMQCELRGLSKGDIKSFLKEFGLYEWKNMKVGKFSKGMKQRLAIASSVVVDPSILILDEPTSGMDPQGMAEVRELIKKLKKDDRLIFMSSHLLPEVTEICDEVAMINRGSLLLYDNIERVTAKFRGSSVEVTTIEPVKAQEVESIPDVESVKQITPTKIIIDFKGSGEQQYEILKSIISRGIKVADYRTSGLALERAYIKLIGVDNHE